MLIVISPAKTLDFDSPPKIRQYSEPVFLDESQLLINKLKKYTPKKLSKLMGISDKLGNLNVARYNAWQAPFTPDNAKQALLAFKGDVYIGLNAESFSAADLKYAQNHLRILSGLYGVLRPLDLMQAYRLEMGTKLSTRQGKDLYGFWDKKITESINQDLEKDRSGILINLASNEYFKSIQRKQLDAEIVTPVFKDYKNGKYKFISFLAKKARGSMASFIVKNRIKDVKDIKNFRVDGYAYDKASSSEAKLVFLRNNE